ncbi:MAG: hypothetical protein JXQ90_18850, partial [Cyclobacteriaceae bacterium]
LTKIYGSENPTLTYSYDGFVLDDDSLDLDNPPVITTEVEIGSGVGIYPIVLSSGDDDKYEFSYVSGALDVTKALLTVTATNLTKIYGSENPELTYSYDGFVLDDDSLDLDNPPAITTDAVVGSGVGIYSINPSSGEDNNYNFSYVSGALEVTKASLMVTAADLSKTYGSLNPELTYSYEGFVLDDDSLDLDNPPVITTEAEIGSGVDVYPIVLSSGEDNNYNFSYVSGALNVTKAPLTVTAKDLTKTYGSENPELKYSYDGFVLDDDSLDLDSDPLILTTCVDTSSVGSYAIVLSQMTDNNYVIDLVNGTLFVGKASQEITFDLSDTVDLSLGSVILNAHSSSGLPITYKSSNDRIASITDQTLNLLDAGHIEVSAFQKGNSNYFPSDTVGQQVFIEKLVELGIQRAFTEGLVFPNPSDDFIRLSIPLYDIRIVDIHGRVMKSISQKVNMINVSDLREGLFFIMGTNENANELMTKILIYRQ